MRQLRHWTTALVFCYTQRQSTVQWTHLVMIWQQAIVRWYSATPFETVSMHESIIIRSVVSFSHALSCDSGQTTHKNPVALYRRQASTRHCGSSSVKACSTWHHGLLWMISHCHLILCECFQSVIYHRPICLHRFRGTHAWSTLNWFRVYSNFYAGVRPVTLWRTTTWRWKILSTTFCLHDFLVSCENWRIKLTRTLFYEPRHAG